MWAAVEVPVVAVGGVEVTRRRHACDRFVIVVTAVEIVLCRLPVSALATAAAEVSPAPSATTEATAVAWRPRSRRCAAVRQGGEEDCQRRITGRHRARLPSASGARPMLAELERHGGMLDDDEWQPELEQPLLGGEHDGESTVAVRSSEARIGWWALSLDAQRTRSSGRTGRGSHA